METIKVDHKFVVNPAYLFRNDISSIVLTNNISSVFDSTYPAEEITSSFTWKIHPDLFFVFRLFNGQRTLQDIWDLQFKKHDITIQDFKQAIIPYVENKDVVITPLYEKFPQSIPKNFLIHNDSNIVRNDLLESLNINSIKDNLDLTTQRLRIPNAMTLMLTTACVTDCVYCYADRPSVKNPISFDRLRVIIKEATDLRMTTIDLDGGDFFLYSHWRELLADLYQHGYCPQISTKHPITKEIIRDLQRIGVNKIQLSLDSIINDEVKKILKVGDDYLREVMKGIELLDSAGFEITIKPVITKFNDSVQSLNSMIDYLKQFDNIRRINFTPADYSRFKRLSSYCSNRKQLSILNDICESRNEECEGRLSFLGYNTPVLKEDKLRLFSKRSICSGNAHSFFVLPDGKVTVCEQMYWHPFFILGDLNKQSIMEMWESEKALSLWNFSKEDVRDESPCKQCSDFEKCRRGLGNCWRLAISAFGDDSYDYPAPDCPYAPNIEEHDFYIPET